MAKDGRRGLESGLIGLLLIAWPAIGVGAPAPSGDGPRTAMTARIAYYPGYDKLQLRTEELPFRTPAGKVGLAGRYFANPALDGEPAATRVDRRLDLQWKKKAPHEDLPADGFSVRWRGRLAAIPRTGEYRFTFRHGGGMRAWIGGEKVLAKWAGAGRSAARVELEKGTRPKVRIEYRHESGTARARVGVEPVTAGSAGAVDATLLVREREGKVVQRHGVSLPRFGGRSFVAIEPLEPGAYGLELTGENHWFRHEVRGRLRASTPIWHRDFAWEGNDLGITDEIRAPFEPIEVKKNRIDVVLRRYELNGLGLPRQIEARGQDPASAFVPLLTGPVVLRANGERIGPGKGSFTKVGDREAVYEGGGAHPAVRVATRTTTSFDGCMRVRLTLKPGTEGEPLESLTLEIPMRKTVARLFHVVKGAPRIRTNPAGAIPSGEGRVWHSGRMHDPNWPGNFKPYLWLGGASRGLCWFADNEKGWIVDWDEKPPCQTIHRAGDTAALRVHLGQKPIELEEKRTILFGLMASPAKPMREDWRRIGTPHGKKIAFKMGRNFGLNANYAAKYPRGKDFSPFEKFEALRKGKRVDIDAFVEKWAKRHFHDGMSEALKERFRNLLTLQLETAKGSGAGTYFTSYFEEFRATTTWHEDFKVYWSEWKRKFDQQVPNLFTSWADWPIEVSHLGWFQGTGAAVPSYRDFAVYFASKWIEHGTGVYFDNTFMEPSFNLVSANAYVRSDGEIQPSAQIWARRKYLRRVWNLHKKLYDPKAPQIMMLHMTNSHVVPYMVWNQANLDLEWKLPGVKVLQKKFSPDLLRAESLGRQTGNVPLAMVKPGKNPGNVSEDRLKAVKRTYRAGLYVHEIKWAPAIQVNPGHMPKPMRAFGYGRKGTEVWNYWQRDAPVSASDEKCKWLLLKRGDELLLVLCTWREKKSKVTLKLDLAQLGVSPTKPVDVEHPGRDKVIDELAGAIESGGEEEGVAPAQPEKKLDWQRYDSRDWQGPIAFSKEQGELTVPLSAYGVRYIKLK